MRSSSGLVGPSLSSSRLEAYDVGATRTGSGLLIAALLHTGFLAAAYLRPPEAAKRRSPPITMEMVKRPKLDEPPPPPTPPPEPPPLVPPPTVSRPQVASRPLPRELQPVARPNAEVDPHSSAIVVGPTPPGPPERGPVGVPKGPIDLFPKSIGSVVGVPGPNAAIPKGPDRLFKDDRLAEKKEPPFELIPEKGGGFKCETRSFIAHITPDGTVSFENRFPIGFQKGGTFSFDLTELAMRGAKQDPYYTEKRRFSEFTDKLRDDLRKKARDERGDQALVTLGEQLRDIWRDGSSAASRRLKLYEKWADSTEDKDDKVGRKSRHAVEDFIRGHLPEGGPDAFTVDELAKINSERQGLAAFAPYGVK